MNNIDYRKALQESIAFYEQRLNDFVKRGEISVVKASKFEHVLKIDKSGVYRHMGIATLADGSKVKFKWGLNLTAEEVEKVHRINPEYKFVELDSVWELKLERRNFSVIIKKAKNEKLHR